MVILKTKSQKKIRLSTHVQDFFVFNSIYLFKIVRTKRDNFVKVLSIFLTLKFLNRRWTKIRINI